MVLYEMPEHTLVELERREKNQEEAYLQRIFWVFLWSRHQIFRCGPFAIPRSRRLGLLPCRLFLMQCFAMLALLPVRRTLSAQTKDPGKKATKLQPLPTTAAQVWVGG